MTVRPAAATPHIEARPVSETRHLLAECPLWDSVLGQIRWVDSARGLVFRGVLGDRVRTIEQLTFGEPVGSIAVRGRSIVVAGRRNVVVNDEYGRSTILARLIPERVNSRLNDGAFDPAGRFVVGAMSLDGRCGEESLFSVSFDGQVKILDHDLTLSNGICWSPDGQTMYSVDSVPGVVWARPYDVISGNAGGREALIEIGDGKPDGVCVDELGRLWLAIWGAGQIRCYTPEGTLVQVVDVAAPQVTSCAFVGEGLRTMVITTAVQGLDEQHVAANPYSGALFAVDVGVRGLPPFPCGRA